MNKIITIFLMLSLCSFAHAQGSIKISGYVKDKATDEVLIGAAVLNGKSGVVTNSYGFFSIRVPSGEVSLRTEYVGYNAEHLNIKALKDTTLNIYLNTNNEIRSSVVTGQSESGFNSRFAGSIDIPVSLIQNSPVFLGEPDVIKTIQTQPGVQGGNEGFSGFYVRGGGQDENLILLDGVNIYNVNHFFGLFSAFTPESVKNVSLYTAAIPARFGGRASSVLDIRTKDGNSHRLKGTVSIGLLNDRVHFEGPLFNSKTTFSLSARGSHSFVLGPVMKLSKVKFNFWFYDLNLKLSHKFNDRNSISFMAYNGKDRLRYTNAGKTTAENNRVRIYNERMNMDYGNTVFAFNYNALIGGKVFSNLHLYSNSYKMNFNNYEYYKATQYEEILVESENNFIQKSGIDDLGLQYSLEYSPYNNLHFRAGTDFVVHSYKPENRVKISDSFFEPEKKKSEIIGSEASLYAESNITLNDRLQFDLGLRMTDFFVDKENYISLQPRLSMRYSLTSKADIKASYSRTSQFVHLLTTGGVSLPTDLWVPITKYIPPQITDIYSIGAYYSEDGYELSVEPYFKKSKNVIDYIDTHENFTHASDWQDMVSVGEGRAYGVDFMLRKKGKKTSGFLRYSLSKSERRYPDMTINNGKWFPFTYDRRHYINLYVEHKFNERVDISALWTFASGHLVTVPERLSMSQSINYVNVRPENPYDGHISVREDYVVPSLHYTSRNNYRTPSSHRLDINVNFRKQKKSGERIWTIGLYNAYFAKNPNMVQIVSLQDKNNAYGIAKTTLFAIMPTVSYTFKF